MLGQTISNRYKITEEFLSDSLSILYKAQDLTENKPVFIKVLTAKAKARPLEALLRFKKEIEQASKINQPNLLKIYAQDEFEGQDYLVLEYFDSKPLSKILDAPLDVERTVELILQISPVLDAAHQKGIIHRNINSSSILVQQTGHFFHAKLTDFGMGLLVDLAQINQKEDIIRTFGYLSPESSGILRKPVDLRSDIYSFGILVYQLFTGQLPYKAEDVSSLIHQHIAQLPPSPSALNPKIPPVIENIVLRLIAKDPQDRYQSLTGVIFDLMEYQNQKSQGKEQIDFEIGRFDRLRQLSFSTRLIGREVEFTQLKRQLEQAKQSQGSLCFVFGEPGIGKSRLVDELRAQVHSLNGLFCGGKCYQFEFRTPYKVFSEAIDAYIEKIKRLSQKEQEAHIKHIKETLGELGGEVVKIASSITDLIGIPPKLVQLEPEKEKIRFLITVTNFLASLSSPDSPLLMFLDDLQWVDDGSLEILERFVEKIKNTNTFLIVSYRDTEVDQNHPLVQLIKKLNEQNITLSNIPVKSFTLHETAEMVGQILMSKEEEAHPLAQELIERAKGNPFFTLELLHSLVDSGVIYLQEDRYIYDLEKLKTASLPTSIVDAVLKRMKDLSEDALKILSYASIMGREIQFSLLVDLTQQPQDLILTSIENGIQSQLLYRDITGQENIFFMHDRIREAFYKRVPQEERIPLHRHIAEVLEQQNKDNPGPVLYDLAYHFTQGQVEEKAVRYSIPAAHKAKSSYAHSLAISLYKAAKEILERQNRINTSEYIDVLENLGEVYRLAGQFDESINTLQNCESRILLNDRIHKAQVISKMGDTLWDKGEVEEGGKLLEQALGILEIRIPGNKLGVVLSILKEFFLQMLHTRFPKFFVSEQYKGSLRDLIVIRLFNRLGHTTYYYDLLKTFYIALKTLNLSEKIGPCPELAYNYTSIMAVWFTIPWLNRAFRDGDKGLRMAQELGDKAREGCACAYYSVLLYIANKPRECFEHAQRGVNILKGLGEYFDLGVAYSYIDHSNCLLGRLREDVQNSDEVIRVMKEAKVMQSLGWGFMQRGMLFCYLGEVDEALIADIKESKRLMLETRDKVNLTYSISTLAFAYSRRGEYSECLQLIEEAGKLFSINKGTWVLDVLLSCAQVCLDAILNEPNLSKDKKEVYFRKAAWFCRQSFDWGRKCQYVLGWSYQVNGTYLWLTGKKKKAIRTWDKGLKFLRENKNNPGGDKYRIAYLLLEEAKFLLQDNPKDKKAYSNLIEARDLFTEMGCKLDLETTNKLLESLSPEGLVVDSRQVLTQKRHLDSLLSVTQAIGSIFILDELLQKILEYGLKVTGAERGFLLLYDQTKALTLKVSHGLEKELQSLSFSYENYKLSLELINEVTNTKTATISDQQTAPNAKITSELKTYQTKQAIAVPLQTRDKPLGILYLDNRLAGGMFGKDELELMKGFAVQASVSIDNAYLVSSLVEQERLKQELELGRQIQESLLPKESPVIAGLKLCGLMLPAKEIGGDYYDFILNEKGSDPFSAVKRQASFSDSLSIVIGDVSGKGVAAGLLMAMAKTAIHTLSQEETSPRTVLLRTNQILVKHIASQKFMTMLYFRYELSSKTLTYSSAGHEHILIYRCAGKNVESIISGGFMLGMIPDIASFLEDKTITLNPGDKIILYTDGVTEARNPNEDLFSLERLIDIIAKYGHKPAQELMNSIKEEVYNYIGTREQYDDITLVVMEAT